MIIYKCDRCGDIVDSYDHIHRIETREPTIKDTHLCQRCYEGLGCYLSGCELQLRDSPVPSHLKRFFDA